MVFVPFTGVDNHKKSITFAAGLILKEDEESYTWLFTNFKKAMGHEPNIILTDQDPAVKVAIETVFTTAVHRFCMWHIMMKVPSKVGPDLANDEDCRKKFNNVVWNAELTREQFFREWIAVMNEFDMQDKPWFRRLFDLRHYWIAAFFNDVKMGGLLRTTSRSESQNSFFNNFIGTGSDLVQFMNRFNNAIDSQRHTQQKLIFDSSTCTPTMKTPLKMEKHCA